MNEQEINQYLNGLIEKEPNLEGLEKDVFDNFKKISGQILQYEKKLKNLQQETMRTDTFIKNLQGQLDAYAQLLVSSEKNRRTQHSKNLSGISSLLPKEKNNDNG